MSKARESFQIIQKMVSTAKASWEIWYELYCKRSIIGSYHKVSIKHLDAYLDELEHRFNNRTNEYILRELS